MQHITYRPIDRQFRCLERDLPPGAPFNRVDPIDGITFGFALESRFPEEVYFGTVAGEVVDDPAIGLAVLTKAQYDAAEAAEMAAREAKARPVVPSSVTMRQAKITLSRAGHLAAANAAIADMPDQPGEEARLEWEYATTLRRDHPLIAGIGAALGLDEAAIDALFVAAAKIE